MKIKTSWVVAVGIAVAASAWILSGMIGGGDAETAEAVAPAAQATQAAKAPTRVRTQLLQAGDMQKTLSVFGRTQPSRDVTVRAETGGRVEEMAVAKGQRVKKGDLLVRLAMNDRDARRREAAALVAQRQLEFEQSRKLARSDFASRTRVAQAQAELDKARAALARVEDEIDNVTIEAPFDGIFNENMVDEGAYVAPGEVIGRIIDDQPMSVLAEVSEREVDDISVGARGTVRLVGGREVPGTVTWVSTTANPTTRTYPVEMELPNTDADSGQPIAVGMTAEMRLPLRSMTAHLVSPAVLTLNEAGEVGVKTVGDDRRVAFHAVDLVADGPGGVWLSGLPRSVRLITVGQEFVRAGDVVEPVPQGDDAVISALPADGAAAAKEAAQ